MKKTIFAILATVAMVACSNDEIVSLNQEAIQFGNAFVDNSVRAEEAADPSYGTNNLLKEVFVYGTVTGNQNPVSIFEYDKVWTEATDGDYGDLWKCDRTQYWIAGANYKFLAVAGVDRNNITCTNGIPSSLTFEPNGETDLVCGYYEKENAAKTNNGYVTFDMMHLLSKVKFTLVNEKVAATEYKYSITNIKISNAVTNGTCTLSTTKVNNNFKVSGAWTTTATGVQSFGEIATEDYQNGTDECEQEKLLIPINQPDVQFTLNLYYGTSLISSTPTTITADSVNLEAGKAYNFQVKVGVGEEIQFTVKENPTWTEVPATNLN